MYREREKEPELNRLTFNLKFTVAEKLKHHHHSLLERFEKKLNKDRGEGTPYKKLSIPRIAKMLQLMTYDEREEFYLECENVKWTSFPQYFHWKLPQKIEAIKKRLAARGDK